MSAADDRRKWRSNPSNLRKHVEGTKKYQRNLRAEIHGHLGGMCAVCGAEDGLVIDHIYSTGGSLRKARGTVGHLVDIRNSLRSGVNRFRVQLLCPEHHTLKTKLEAQAANLRCDMRPDPVLVQEILR